MTIREIKEKALRDTDIVSVVQRFVKLKKQGHNWLGICPFHNERTPSFAVDPVKRIFKCFGCGKGGDVIEFIMAHEGKAFIEALEILVPGQRVETEISSWDGEKKRVEIVDPKILEQTLVRYDNNPFIQFLSRICGEEKAIEQAMKYFVGTAQNNGTIFWQVDILQRVRTGQKIHYGDDGHRLKHIKPLRLFTQSKGYQPCLFGEHLLINATREHLVGIVESEKTAIICDLYLPRLYGRPIIWIASVGSNGLTHEKCQVLKGLEVVLCPDFHYTARAIWGCREMRKKDVDGKVQICEDGDVDEEYVPLKVRVALIAKTVSFLDEWKDVNDKSDIADLLIKTPVSRDTCLSQTPVSVGELPFD